MACDVLGRKEQVSTRAYSGQHGVSVCGKGVVTHLYGTPLPGIDSRLALLAKEVSLAVRHFRAEDLGMAADEL